MAANPGADQNYLNRLVAVAALSSDDVWAVGRGFVTDSASDATLALIEHWDGKSWRVIPGADLGGRSASLAAIVALAPDDIWAVGQFEATSSEQSFMDGLIEHWDGRRWSLVASPKIPPEEPRNIGRGLVAIEALSSTDTWALGYSWPNGPGATVSRDIFEHWDGKAWTIVPSPQDESSTGMSAMQDLSVVASDDVWAVGGRVDGFSEAGVAGGAVAEHWDGREWSPITPPSGNVPLTHVAAVSSNDVWAVRGGEFRAAGSYGFGPVEIIHWDGETWRTSLRLGERGTGTIRDIVARAPNDAWAVGAQDGQPLIEHWDGKTWTIPADFESSSAIGPLTSVSNAPDETLIAFSGQGNAADPPQNEMWFQCGNS